MLASSLRKELFSLAITKEKLVEDNIFDTGNP